MGIELLPTVASEPFKVFKNAPACAACQGGCCSQAPGVSVPLQWGAPSTGAMKVRLREALLSGEWKIQSRDHNVPWSFELTICLVVVPAGKLEVSDCNGWHSELVRGCIFQEATGCRLPWKRRPLECVALEPVAGGHCKCHGSDLYQKWLPYQDLLAEVCKDLPSGFDYRDHR
jgi:hypothetical protein